MRTLFMILLLAQIVAAPAKEATREARDAWRMAGLQAAAGDARPEVFAMALCLTFEDLHASSLAQAVAAREKELVALLSHALPRVREVALYGLRQVETPELGGLEQQLSDANPQLRISALRAFQILGHRAEGSHARIETSLQDRDPKVQAAAAQAWLATRPADRSDHLAVLGYLDHPRHEVRIAALNRIAIQKSRWKEYADRIDPLLEDRFLSVRQAAVSALMALEAGDNRKREALMFKVRRDTEDFRRMNLPRAENRSAPRLEETLAALKPLLALRDHGALTLSRWLEIADSVYEQSNQTEARRAVLHLVGQGLPEAALLTERIARSLNRYDASLKQVDGQQVLAILLRSFREAVKQNLGSDLLRDLGRVLAEHIERAEWKGDEALLAESLNALRAQPDCFNSASLIAYRLERLNDAP